jgi:hypothetical protein
VTLRRVTLPFIACVAALCVLAQVRLAFSQETAGGRPADDAALRIAEFFPLLRGMVVSVDGDRVLVDLGKGRGVYEGMELEVYREGEEINHPVTGESLGRRDVRLAIVRVIEVRPEFSEAAVVRREANAALSWGDGVRISGDLITVAVPTIDPGGSGGPDVRVLTKDLAIALMKTGRFVVLEDHVIRDALTAEGARAPHALPAELRSMAALAEAVRADAAILGKLRAMEGGVFLDLQVLSTRTGATLGIASVPIGVR